MANNIKLNNPLANPLQPKKGSGFVNLNKILRANQGNQLGQTVATGLGQGAQQVQQGLGDVKSQFIQEADKQNLNTDANKQAVSDALKKISEGQTDVSDQLAQQFGTFRAGQYAGPKELDPTKTVQLGSKAQEFEGLGQTLQGGGDTTRLLQAFAGKGPYSAGQSRLDSLLLGQGPQAKQQLAEARQQTRGLTQQVGREEANAAQIAQLRAGQAKQFGEETNKQLLAPQEQIQGDINKSVDFQRAALQREIDRYKADPMKFLQTDTKQTYGLGPEAFQPGKGVIDFARPEDYTVNNLASNRQLAQLNALSKLGGKAQEFVTDPTQAETAGKINPYTINRNNLQNMVNQRKSEFQTETSGPLAELESWAQNAAKQKYLYADPKIQDKINLLSSLSKNKYQQQVVTPDITKQGGTPKQTAQTILDYIKQIQRVSGKK